VHKRIVRIGTNTQYRDLAGEGILLQLETGACFTLDATANRAWQLIAELHDLDRVAAALAGEYHAPEGVIASDLQDLVARLLEKKLIEIEPLT